MTRKQYDTETLLKVLRGVAERDGGTYNERYFESLSHNQIKKLLNSGILMLLYLGLVSMDSLNKKKGK